PSIIMVKGSAKRVISTPRHFHDCPVELRMVGELVVTRCSSKSARARWHGGSCSSMAHCPLPTSFLDGLASCLRSRRDMPPPFSCRPALRLLKCSWRGPPPPLRPCP